MIRGDINRILNMDALQGFDALRGGFEDGLMGVTDMLRRRSAEGATAALIEKYNALVASKNANAEQHNRLVDDHIRLVEDYNGLATRMRALTDKYNEVVDKHNALVRWVNDIEGR